MVQPKQEIKVVDCSPLYWNIWDVQYFRDADLSEEFCNPSPGDTASPLLRRRPCCTSDAALPSQTSASVGRERGDKAPSPLGQRAMPFPSRLSSLISDATVDYALQFHSKPLCLILILTRFCPSILLTSHLYSFTTKMSPFPSLFPFEYPPRIWRWFFWTPFQKLCDKVVKSR